MTEIRPIRPSEADAFLRLLCSVFALDLGKARSIFYNEPMYDLQRKWALFDCGRPVSILTTVPLSFGWGKAIGIAGVATDQERQGQGLARQLLRTVLYESRAKGEVAAYLFARSASLYEHVGFEVLDYVVRSRIDGAYDSRATDILAFEDVRACYDSWSCCDPSRLKRDSQRWKYWKWTLRMCAPIPEGYVCLEGGMLREVIGRPGLTRWPVGQKTEWFGLSSMAEKIGVGLTDPTKELLLMGYGSPGVPQMFMTDQF